MLSEFRRADYIHLGGKQIAEVDSVKGVQYVHTDALGSPVAATNAAGQIVRETRYEPYGGIAGGTAPSAATSQVGFTGHVQDLESGLVYAQQRYYHPIAGRFLSVDPVVADTKSGGQFNRYNYANGNPYKFTDPDGREPDTKRWSDPAGMSRSEATAGMRMAGEVVASVVPGTSTVEHLSKGQLGMAAAMLVVDVSPAKLLKVADKVADAVRAENLAAGIPASALGPSGKPKIHVAEHASLKEAKDAARATVGAGGTTVKHANPAVGGSHFHGVNSKGVKDRVHHEYKKE